MKYTISYAFRSVLMGTAAVAVAFSVIGTEASAQGILGIFGAKKADAETAVETTMDAEKKRKDRRVGKDRSEEYLPTIWIDPDGCEHWVMDDGAEGYMTPHTNRQGIPVCRRGNICDTIDSDQLFASGSAKISSRQSKELAQFFQSNDSTSYIVTGHTDSDASDEYNMKLSYRRAAAVAAIAESSGSKVADVRGYGERFPVATNKTKSGKAKNRRVEIICIR